MKIQSKAMIPNNCRGEITLGKIDFINEGISVKTDVILITKFAVTSGTFKKRKIRYE